jgi:hypothetical protein
MSFLDHGTGVFCGGFLNSVAAVVRDQVIENIDFCVDSLQSMLAYVALPTLGGSRRLDKTRCDSHGSYRLSAFRYCVDARAPI